MGVKRYDPIDNFSAGCMLVLIRRESSPRENDLFRKNPQVFVSEVLPQRKQRGKGLKQNFQLEAGAEACCDPRQMGDG